MVPILWGMLVIPLVNALVMLRGDVDGLGTGVVIVIIMFDFVLVVTIFVLLIVVSHINTMYTLCMQTWEYKYLHPQMLIEISFCCTRTSALGDAGDCSGDCSVDGSGDA